MSKAVPAIRFILFEAGCLCVMKSRPLRCCSWEQLRRYVPCVTVVVRPVWGGIFAFLLSRLPRDAASCLIRDYLDVWKHRFLRDVIFRQARCVSVFGTVVLTTVWSGMFYGRYHPVLYRMIYPVFSGMVSRRERDGCRCAFGSIVPFVTGVSGQALSRILRDVAE